MSTVSKAPLKPSQLHDELLARGLSPRTARQYLREIIAAQQWMADGGRRLDNATASAVAAYIATRPTSHSTRKLIRQALSHYWAITGRKNPPAKAVRTLKKPRMVCRALDENDAVRLAKAAAGWYPEGTATLLGLYQALRREEIASLPWTALSGGWLKVTGKGGVTATILAHPAVVHELERIPRRDARYLFPGRYGSHVNPTTVWTWIKKVGDRAGVDVTTHWLRHTALATALDATRDLRAVQDFARHADPSTTAGYTRSNAERMRWVVEAIHYD